MRHPSSKRSSGYLPQSLQTNDAARISVTDIQRARFEADAVLILERVLHRTRWKAQDRDAIADRLVQIVEREIRLGRDKP
ncbi:hypothetical protein [Paracoccus aerius]